MMSAEVDGDERTATLGWKTTFSTLLTLLRHLLTSLNLRILLVNYDLLKIS